jgi:hypothetical protein
LEDNKITLKSEDAPIKLSRYLLSRQDVKNYLDEYGPELNIFNSPSNNPQVEKYIRWRW